MIKCIWEVEKYIYQYFPSNQQIRKLRRELDASQEKVATLTSQLTANVSWLPNLHDNTLKRVFLKRAAYHSAGANINLWNLR